MDCPDLKTPTIQRGDGRDYIISSRDAKVNGRTTYES